MGQMVAHQGELLRINPSKIALNIQKMMVDPGIQDRQNPPFLSFLIYWKTVMSFWLQLQKEPTILKTKELPGINVKRYGSHLLFYRRI